jgi:hypothetical protein
MQLTSDSGYVLAGCTGTGSTDSYDFYVVRTNSLGDMLWTRTYGSDTEDEWAKSVQQTSDGGYVVAGYTGSFFAGSGTDNDFYVVKIEPDSLMSCCNHDGIRGDADGSGAITVNDLTYLTNYIFHIPPDPPPPCYEEGDADGSGSINIGDPTYLTNYIFHIPPDPPPPPCP